MTLRRVYSALFASILFTGFAASAQAAPVPHMTRHHRTVTHASAHPSHATMRRGATMRGGDAQNSAVDQLNAQSLQRATGQ